MSTTPDRHAWSRPEPEPLAGGVLRVPLPLPFDALRAVNVYVLDDAPGLTLVDGGWTLSHSRDLLESALAGIGAGIGDITRFLVTHLHRDHYTQAVALRRETGARVALGAGERGSLGAMAAREAPFAPQIAGLRAAGAGELADGIVANAPVMTEEEFADFAGPDDWIADGERIEVGRRTLTALETPGHTLGHLVYERDDALFAGDHVLPHITPSIGFEPGARPGALQRFLSSLALVRARPDRLLLPAHGPVAPSVHARVDELLAHHGARLDEIERVVGGGATTGAEVAGAMTWTRRETKLADLEPFHRMLAVLETDAHLEVLAAQGRVERVAGVDGVQQHRAA